MVGTLAALFFSAQLRDRFDGFCASAMIWLVFGLIFVLVGMYQIILAHNAYLSMDLVAKIFLICVLVANVTYILAAWIRLHRMRVSCIQKLRNIVLYKNIYLK